MKRHGRQIWALALCACLLLAVLPARAAGMEFSDVPASAWYAKSLSRLLQEAPGTIGGMGNGRFAPDMDTTRAQFMKMLCAFSGEALAPDFEERYGAGSSFSDVSGWAAPYVEWAFQNGLAEGTGNGLFSPGKAVTREQIAALLYRYAVKWEGMEPVPSESALSPFYDSWKIGSWAREAVTWAVYYGIMGGFDAHTLEPGRSATRAQVVTMLCNYLDYRERDGEAPNLPETGGFQPVFTQVNGTRVIDAPYIDQRIKYPTGCESVSAVMALQYFGMEVTPEIFIDGYLPKGRAPHYDLFGRYVGCDPRKAFPGNPYTQEGWGCYSQVIESSLKKIISDRAEDSGLTVRRLNGESLQTLCRSYTDNGIPVLLWATMGMEAPQISSTFQIEGTSQTFTWIYPMHCLLLVGRDDSYYYFNDPLRGKTVRYSSYAVERAYAGLGRQAIVVQAN